MDEKIRARHPISFSFHEVRLGLIRTAENRVNRKVLCQQAKTAKPHDRDFISVMIGRTRASGTSDTGYESSRRKWQSAMAWVQFAASEDSPLDF